MQESSTKEQGAARPSVVTEDRLRQIVREAIAGTFIPTSTYRVQLNKNFTFRQATALVPYWKELGIGAIYCSPYFQAVPGSAHGYDVTDPNRLNPEIGTEEDHAAFCAALKENGIGQILDFVSNHMGIAHHANALWQDVLENGPVSLTAHYFDIDWHPVKEELENKVLLPILGEIYGSVLEKGAIRLAYDHGRFLVHCNERILPVAPTTYPFILEQGLEELKTKLGAEDKDFLEYLSVMTAFRNLPGGTEQDLEKKRERNREKEIAKGRLAALVERNGTVGHFLETRAALFCGKPGDPRSFDLLDQLLNRQVYRLAYWRTAAEEINYRRFFDINELAALRVEDEDVFTNIHKKLFELIRDGKAQGLRIDHPDGLYDPPEYFRRLQEQYLFDKIMPEADRSNLEACAELRAALKRVLQEKEFFSSAPLYVVAEKILDRRESLPDDWNVHGTVGYEFSDSANGIFVETTKEARFDQIYCAFSKTTLDFDQLVYEKKKFFAAFYMAAEINTLGHRLNRISELSRYSRDYTLNNLITAIREVIACFPVYRTYISPTDTEISERDRRIIASAVERVKGRHPALNPRLFDFLADILFLRLGNDSEQKLYRDFVLRFQQLTAPIMAKGLEDTAFYINNRFLSLNEVGGDPGRFGRSTQEFHGQNAERSKHWPGNLLASSTHDSKRSEDVRMRLNVLSEIPDEWEALIQRWAEANQESKTLLQGVPEPRANTEYFLYQTLVGVWPDGPMGPEERKNLTERLDTYMLKAAREAKLQTNWSNPNEAYEGTVARFVRSLIPENGDNEFLKSFLPFQKKIADFGRLGSLSLVALKLGAPGVPDVYQGTELWNLSLVDPDNRRPVDYAARTQALESLKEMETSGSSGQEILQKLWKSREDGHIKFYLIRKGLCFRKDHPELFLQGTYEPLEARGAKKNNVVAFLRKNGKKRFLTAAARFFTQLVPEASAWPPEESAWADTALVLPEDAAGPWKDLLTGRTITPRKENGTVVIPASALFSSLGAALLSQGCEETETPKSRSSK